MSTSGFVLKMLKIIFVTAVVTACAFGGVLMMLGGIGTATR